MTRRLAASAKDFVPAVPLEPYEADTR